MHFQIEKIRENYFALTLAAALFLGFATAALLTAFLPLLMGGESGGGPESPMQAGRQERIARPFRSAEEFESIITGNLIRDSAQSLSRGAIPGAEAEGGGGAGEFTLLGVVAGSPRFARAAIQLTGQENAEEYKIGDAVAGYTIRDILSNAIIVERGGRRLTVFIGDRTAELKGSVGADTVPVPAGAQRIVISRDRLIKLTRDQAELYKNRFTPVIQDGKIVGLRMLFVPPDNFLYQIGARSGDILRRINGQPLDNMEKMMDFYQSIKSATHVTVDVERAGKIVPYEIVIN